MITALKVIIILFLLLDKKGRWIEIGQRAPALSDPQAPEITESKALQEEETGED